MSVRAIGEEDTVEGTLKQAQATALQSGWTDVMVLAIDKDGGQFLITNHSSFNTKSLLIHFAQAWLFRWFNDGEDL